MTRHPVLDCLATRRERESLDSALLLDTGLDWLGLDESDDSDDFYDPDAYTLMDLYNRPSR